MLYFNHYVKTFTMRWVTTLLIIAVVSIFWKIFLLSRITNDVLKLMELDGYVGELHHATTEDGYILGLQRIIKGSHPRKIRSEMNEYGNVSHTTRNTPPVLIVHGLDSSASDFIIFHGNKSIPYLLFEEGYDVWLGNCRGTFHSFNHTSLDPAKDKKQFFSSSIHDIGVNDLPAMIDYVLNKTMSRKLFYIGMSQGEASFLIMTSTRPEYNEKIQLASLIAISSHLKYSDNALMKTLGSSWQNIQMIYDFLGIYELPFSRDSPIFTVCHFPISFRLCQFLISHAVGYTNHDQDDPKSIARILSVYPTRSAAKQLQHYLQMFNAGKFRNFDHGKENNLIMYGTEEPPEYDLKKILAPIALYSGENDCWSRPKDVEYMAKTLPNVKLNYVVPHKLFNHADFLIAKDAKILVYDKMIDTMEKYR